MITPKEQHNVNVLRHALEEALESRAKTHYLPKDGVLLIKPITAVKGDKELASVRMRCASIGTSH
jgi:hypothetical protein